MSRRGIYGEMFTGRSRFTATSYLTHSLRVYQPSQ